MTNGGHLRRSSCARRAPEILDSSPVPSNRGKKPYPYDDRQSKKKKKKKVKSKKSEEKRSVSVSISFEEEEEGEGWRSRLRSRAKGGRIKGRSQVVKGSMGKRRRVLDDLEEIRAQGCDLSKNDRDEEAEEVEEDEEEKGESDSRAFEVEAGEEGDGVASELKELGASIKEKVGEGGTGSKRKQVAQGVEGSVVRGDEEVEEEKAASDSKALETGAREEGHENQGEEKVASELEKLKTSVKGKAGKKRKKGKRKRPRQDVQESGMQDAELIRADKDEDVEKIAVGEEKVASDWKELETSEQAIVTREEERDDCVITMQQVEEERDECADNVQGVEANPEIEVEKAVADENANNNVFASEKNVKESDVASPMSDNKLSSTRVKEGRRCGLCGGGTDGKPPKKLIKESVDSDNEACEGSSTSEEPNYDPWDGFGDEPGWLGRLVGPIHDRFGIARVWVHQHCAVWSPEVYFAGLGCLKNIRAALCRGRALKCSRCGRPGATIGCRVDRCPKTYHLPCSRAEGCIFDHRKFLIACHDHRRLFQPQGIGYYHQIRKRKARKLKLEMRKHSNDAWRKDLEAEEKWLEHCGEDEEFLKREGKRLHRDILRIAPTYIGGSSENEILHQGWESVAGLQGVIQCMKEVVILPLLYPEFFSNMGLTPPRGVLLHGYPGTGKTLVVRALIGACSRGDKRIAYFARKGADCLGKYVGDAERQLRLLFQVAEKSQPSIIFFDEIDGLAPVRSRHQDQTHSSVVSTLLSLMDGLKSRGSVIVIGATNRPEAIDPALRRPGRFDREIYFPLPSEKDRSAILSLHTQTWPKPLSGALLSWIAHQTVGYAGADLQALCSQAALNALKRNFALKELLSSAEKGHVHGRLPSLPSVIVEEIDWLTALAVAPPPCSRREAGMAANDIVSSPLPAHLIPCLLLPLSFLLISFCNDERIWLPPALSKAAKSIRSIIVSSLERRRVATSSWQSHLHHLLQEKIVLKEIEANLSHYGLIDVPSVSGDNFVSDSNEQKFDSFMLRHSGEHRHKSMKMFPQKSESSSGFRALISGSPRSGQQHLASCLLHSFMGHVEVQKVNLATISQEGHGDLLRGLTQILSKCFHLGRCVIYMPRIDLWAISENLGEDVESPTAPLICKSLTVNNGTKSVSEMWNSFVEQVDSVSTSASLIILATCEIQSPDLPLGIRHFFARDILRADSAASEHKIPRFSVHINGIFDHKLLINSSAEKLSDDLIRNFVQLLHHRTHQTKNQEKLKTSGDLEANSESQMLSMETGQKTGLIDTKFSSEGIACRKDQTQQSLNSDPTSLISGHQEAGIKPIRHQDSFPRILPCKSSTGSSPLAVATFGYQILRCPQFAELCWITSKLREGPSTGSNGPWKDWPFNACIMHVTNSPDKISAGVNSSIHKEKYNSGVVRGLTAVGLLAYRGVYTSVREVTTDVRKVLELLVEQIRVKILAGKDSYQYLRILSQVAYLEDMVNSWAYKFQSSYTNNPTTESNAKLVSTESLCTENNLSGTNLVDKSSSGAPESLPGVSSAKSITDNGQCTDVDKGLSDHPSPRPGIAVIQQTEQLQEDVRSASLPSNRHSEPSLAVTTQDDEDEACRTRPEVRKRLDHVTQLNGLEIPEKSPGDDPNISANAVSSSSKDVTFCNNTLDTVLSCKDSELVPEEPSKISDPTLGKDCNVLAASKVCCFYKCCSGCLHALYMLVRGILSQCWESNGRCSTVDDINNVVSSCSLNILAALRKCYMFENINLAEYCKRTQFENRACQEVGNKKQISCRDKTLNNVFLVADCICHLRKEDNPKGHAENDSSLQQASTYFFRDGVLVSSEPQTDDVLHCRYDKFCLCSMMEIVREIKEAVADAKD
ncbi:uncharacterized protein A4U43_C01F3170 [Asparagus officinalis]|uniref:PHD-type domain-containing protein n=1 Tax=Asparagus officinalis TaxID=4686 RepID=A0A5P1FN10_ASPOF|nr:uncharacterized protein LOC109847271 [Asparagus officinalis]ONK79123.1 uncharacterized protein A4U43_C01F3170 [Asparagus officinalis]